MHCLGVSRALDLGVHSPHYILYMFASLHFHLTSSVVLFVSSYLPCLLLICIIFSHPEWWSSSVHYMEGSHVISTIYPTDVGPGILSLRKSHHQREFMLHWHLRVCYPFLMSSSGISWLRSEHVYLCKKKKIEKKNGKSNKKPGVYCYPSLSVCIDIRGSLDRVCLLTGVRMWASRDPSGFVFILLHIFVSEMSDFLLGALGYCPFHHYVCSWCDITPCLIWVDHHSFGCYSLHYHRPRFRFWFVILTSPLILFLPRPISGLIPFVLSSHISLSVWFASLVSSLTSYSH